MGQEILPEDVNKLFIQLARQHFTRMHSLLGEIGVYRGQPPLLHRLWENDGCTQSELAASLKLKPATVTRMLQRLEKAGLLERRPDPKDQRISRVYITEVGHNIEAGIRQRERQVGAEMLSGFSSEEVPVLVEFLTRLRDNLQQVN